MWRTVILAHARIHFQTPFGIKMGSGSRPMPRPE